MKTIKIILAVVAALYTVGVAIGVFQEFRTHNGVRGTTEIAGGIAAILICAAISAWLFRSGSRKA